MRTQHETSIVDANGVSHEYTTMQFGGEEGFNLFLDLLALGADQLGGVLSAIKPGGSGDLADADVDLDKMGATFAALASKVLQKGGVEFAKRLLVYTFRDGRKFQSAKIAVGEMTWTWNQAYQGNYGEALKALVFVLKANFENLLGGLPLEFRSPTVAPPTSSD